MKRRLIIAVTLLAAFVLFAAPSNVPDKFLPGDKIIFAYGGQINKGFLKYVISLTNKRKPKVCFLPTASGDDPRYIAFWDTLAGQLPLDPYVLRIFSASSNKISFEEQLLQMDIIIAGAGNAVNMLAIWRAQGIDTVLRKAYDKGIILAGGSAGSLCWFKNGYTGSRPLGLTKIEGLGFLEFSHSPHYHSELRRRTAYHKGILNGDISAGYAIDDEAGVVFVNGQLQKVVSQNNHSNSYFVSAVNGQINEQLLATEIIR